MTNGNANEDAAGTITPPTVHLILQGKGVVASWLAEFLIGRGQRVCCIDGDPVNRSLGSTRRLVPKNRTWSIRTESSCDPATTC